MKICGSYHVDELHRAKCDEVRFTTGTIDAAMDFQVRHPNIAVIIECLSTEESRFTTQKLANVIAENDWILDCYELNEYFMYARDYSLKKVMYHYPVNTFNDITLLMTAHPYAISISEPLTFQCNIVRPLISNTLIRVHPAIGRPSTFNYIKDQDNGLKHFWIPPHLIDLYNDYIDVIDVFDQNTARQEALIDTYIDHTDNYSLQVLCKNSESTVLCSQFGEEEIQKRIVCGQKCMQKPNSCHFCDLTVDLIKMAKPELHK